MKGTAYFVKNPSKLSNLVKPHRVEDEVSYEIVRTIYLPQIEYENFATDLTVDRAFIEENAHLCGMPSSSQTGKILSCQRAIME
jgi:hypothetical protein